MDIDKSLLEWAELTLDKIMEYKTLSIIVSSLAVFLFIGFFGIKFYRDMTSVRAHKTLALAIKTINASVNPRLKEDNLQDNKFKTEDSKWKTAEQELRLGYEKNKNSSLAPMFEVLQSESLVNLGILDEAVKVLKSAVTKINSASVKQYYDIKLSLMQMDSKSDVQVKEGLNRLQSIANDQKNFAHAQALFRLGEYYWFEKDFDQVKNFWQRFMVKYGNDESLHLQVDVVKTKLSLISV
jgi:tetratricopeptide (TPR) repeat protein